MQRGDRIQINSPGAWCHDQRGTINSLRNGIADVSLDQPSRSAATSIKESQLVKLINPNKPLRFRMPDMRPVKLIGVMPNGNILIVSTYGMQADSTDWWPTPWLINEHGQRLRDGSHPIDDPHAPLVVNEVEITRGFYPLNNKGEPVPARGLISLSFAKGDYPNAPFFLEIVSHDGVPTSAVIHPRG